MASRIVLNHRGMNELLHSDGVRRHLTGLAEQVKEIAQAGAPQHEIEVQTVTHPTRVVVRVANVSPDAIQYEADHGTLARSLREVT